MIDTSGKRAFLWGFSKTSLALKQQLGDAEINICFGYLNLIGGIKNITIVLGASLGGIASLLAIVDWFARSDPEMRDVQAPVQKLDTAQTAPAPQPTPVVTPTAQPTPRLSPTEQAVLDRLTQQLRATGCAGAKVQDATADINFTPAADSTSGFDGYYLEGSVVVAIGADETLLRVLGTGKGPMGEARAIENAAQSALDQLNDTANFTDICQGETD